MSLATLSPYDAPRQQKGSGKTVFVPLPRDHDHISLRETLLDILPNIKTIHFAPGNLFAVFSSTHIAEDAIQTINDSLRINAQMSRTELAKDPGSNNYTNNNHDPRRLVNEPSCEIILATPRFLEGEDVERVLETYAGFERLQGRKAIFSDALWAWKALDDLNTTTNFAAHFAKLRDEPVLPDTDAEISNIDTNARPPRRHNGARTIFVAKIPKSSNVSIARDLLGMLARYRGFVRLSFQSENQCFVDFYDPASAQNAIARIRATTSMSAALAHKRPTDPTQFPLEAPAAALFVKLESFLPEPEARALFERMPSCEEITFAPQHCIVRFASPQDAGHALDYIRRCTNLVVNYAKTGTRNSITLGHNGSLSDSGPIGSPGVKVHIPPYGANPKELFSIYTGFRGLICDEDGSLIGIYEDINAARRAHFELLRSLSSETTLIRRSFTPRTPKGYVNPSTVLYVSLNTPLTEGQVKRLLASYTGFSNFKTIIKTSGERYGLVQFASVADAQAALEDLVRITNLNVDYSKKGEGAFIYSAGDGRPRMETRTLPSGPVVNIYGSTESTVGRNDTALSNEEDEIRFQEFAGNKRNTEVPAPTIRAAGKDPRGSARNVLHLTSPPHSISTLKKYATSQLSATRLIIKRNYCFIVFPDHEIASKAIPKLAERFPACEVQFARSDVSQSSLNASGKSHGTSVNEAPSESLVLNVGWSGAEPVFADLCRNFEGFKEVESISPSNGLAHFGTQQQAQRALEDLNSTTNVQCAYATRNIGTFSDAATGPATYNRSSHIHNNGGRPRGTRRSSQSHINHGPSAGNGIGRPNRNKPSDTDRTTEENITEIESSFRGTAKPPALASAGKRANLPRRRNEKENRAMSAHPPLTDQVYHDSVGTPTLGDKNRGRISAATSQAASA
ncbi:hypothetical protein PhCBS80983_g06061 [Powellomyces hirtus]|uniref:RRM domain-containing protein n=1 Tax=Powellomyces hirtus TaxID=109895 RepID=A0A507DQT2_9FUNG|nr:hypothetical protein PhCBS80983_g06061 [Powellomyces hirtus]